MLAMAVNLVTEVIIAADMERFKVAVAMSVTPAKNGLGVVVVEFSCLCSAWRLLNWR